MEFTFRFRLFEYYFNMKKTLGIVVRKQRKRQLFLRFDFATTIGK